jgi:hypothetical protein
MTFNESDNEQKNLSRAEIQDQSSKLDMLEQRVIPLLEERLMVDLARQKMGEIVVRKEIETHTITVNVPVRNEKIIVEQVSPIYKKIAEVSLGKFASFDQSIQDKNNSEILQLIAGEKPILDGNSNSKKIISGDLDSFEDAHNFLDLVFSQTSGFEGSIRVELILNN